jgi:hypothetical protein
MVPSGAAVTAPLSKSYFVVARLILKLCPRFILKLCAGAVTLPFPRYVIAKTLAKGGTAFYFNVPTCHRKLGCPSRMSRSATITRPRAGQTAKADVGVTQRAVR